MKKISLKPQDVVCRKGEPATCLYILERGTLGVYAGDDSDALKLGTITGAGTTFGEIGAILSQPRSATILAISDSDITEIPVKGKELENTIMARPELGLKIAVTVAARLRDTNFSLNEGVKFSAKVRDLSEKYHFSYFEIIEKIREIYAKFRFSWLKDVLIKSSSNTSYTRGKIVSQKKGKEKKGTCSDAPSVNVEPTSMPCRASEDNILTYSTGDYICREGEIGDTMFILCSGTLSVFVKDMCVADISKKGTIIGEVAAIMAYRNPGSGEKRTASLRAKTDVKMITIRSDQLKTAFTKDPQMLVHVIRTVSEKLIQTNNSLNQLIADMLRSLNEIHVQDGELTLYRRIVECYSLIETNDPKLEFLSELHADLKELIQEIPQELKLIGREFSKISGIHSVTGKGGIEL